MPTPTHFFSLSYPKSTEQYCGGWKSGDSWTVTAADVTCPACLRLRAEAEWRPAESSAGDHDVPDVEDWVAGESLP